MNDKAKSCMWLLLISIIASGAPEVLGLKEGYFAVISVLGVFGAILAFICAIIAIFHEDYQDKSGDG